MLILRFPCSLLLVAEEKRILILHCISCIEHLIGFAVERQMWHFCGWILSTFFLSSC